MRGHSAPLGVILVCSLALSSFVFISPMAQTVSGATVKITSDSDFAACGCVGSGAGTQTNPFMISGLALYSKNAPGILVDNTNGKITKYFDVARDTVTGGNGPATSFPGVEFVNVDGLGEITGGQNVFNGNQYGILLVGDHNILVDGVSDETGATANSNGIAGIAVVGGGSNTVSNYQVAHNGVGIPENFISGGMGIQMNFTSGNTVRNLVLSEDSQIGLFLYQSTDNFVSGVIIHYPDFYGGVVDGGSGNTITSSVFQSGDYVGLWLRDSTSNNLISNNQLLANGPTGKEVKPGIVPYFTSGLYISSGAFNNQIQNNYFNRANTGGSIIQDNGHVVNGVPSPVQSNNPFNDPDTGNEPASPLFPSGPAGVNSFCGNSIYATQGVPGNPSC